MFIYFFLDLMWFLTLVWAWSNPNKTLFSLIFCLLSLVVLSSSFSSLENYILLLVVVCDIYVIILLICLSSHPTKSSLSSYLFGGLLLFVISFFGKVYKEGFLSLLNLFSGVFWFFWSVFLFSLALVFVSFVLPKAKKKEL